MASMKVETESKNGCCYRAAMRMSCFDHEPNKADKFCFLKNNSKKNKWNC